MFISYKVVVRVLLINFDFDAIGMEAFMTASYYQFMFVAKYNVCLWLSIGGIGPHLLLYQLPYHFHIGQKNVFFIQLATTAMVLEYKNKQKTERHQDTYI